jgi:AcrR family transcriptional regulator
MMKGKSTDGEASVDPQAAAPRRRRNAVSRKPPQPTTPRGRATRERLKAAVATLLRGRAIHEIRLEDIADQAGVRMSLIYHYFQSKEDIACEVLSDILEAFKAEIAGRDRDTGPLDAIHFANQRMIALYAANPGAMRCLLEAHQETAPFSRMWRDLTLDWNRRIAASLARQFPGAFPAEAQFVALAYALAGMVDNFLYEYYVLANPVLRQALADEAAVARFLTTLWRRALYLRNPPAEFLGEARGFEIIGAPQMS